MDRVALPVAVLLLAPLLLGALPGDAGPSALPVGTAAAERSLVASDPVTVTALAVAEADGGLVGVSAKVHATAVRNGSGQVFVATKPLAQTDMQGSARLAARVAAQTLGLDWRDYDHFLVFESQSVVIGGPSAGATMAVAAATALNNLAEPAGREWTLDPRVAMTGTINPDGTVGPVGGIPAKAEAAADEGVDLFLFPAGQEQALLTRNGRRTVVDVADFCAQRLGIVCQPVATVRTAIEKTAGVRIEAPPVPTPSTAGYADILEPAVRPLTEGLAARVEAAGAARDANASAMSSEELDRVDQALAEAEDRLGRARTALADGRFYTTATMAFQGAIQVGFAENLTRLFTASNPSDVVAGAVGTCQAAVASARDHAFPLDATTMNAVYAVGAAQRRVAQAEGLLRDASQAFRQGTAADAWPSALFDASFCAERARTVVWWADLRDAFGPGPPMEDPGGLARDVLDLARERVVYAQAVLQGGDAGQAPGLLEEAGRALDAGRHAQAIVTGAEAQAEASIAVQAAGGGVSTAVVQAARDATSNAVAAARAAGVEPILSVALFELSQDVEGNRTALSFLWTARSLAALVPTPGPRDVGQTFVGSAPELDRTPRDTEFLLLGAVSGFLGGVLVTGVAALLLGGSRREDGGGRGGGGGPERQAERRAPRRTVEVRYPGVGERWDDVGDEGTGGPEPDEGV